MARNGRRADEALLAGLAAGKTVQEAAASGVSIRTAFRRLEDPQFRQQLDGVRKRILARATDKLHALTERAVATLDDLMVNGPPAVRLRAAHTVLENTSKAATENSTKTGGERITADAQRKALLAAIEAEIAKRRIPGRRCVAAGNGQPAHDA